MRPSFLLHFLRYVIITLLLFASTNEVVAQLGENCTDPVVISALPYDSPKSFRYSTCGTQSDYNFTCNNMYSEGGDFVFKYTSPSTESCISINLETFIGQRFGLFVTEGCPVLGGDCVASGVNTQQKAASSRSIRLEDVHLKPNTDYYITVDGYYPSTLACSTFELEVRPMPCVKTPKGSDCGTAVRINTVPYTNPGVSSCGNYDIINEGNQCNGTLNDNLSSGKDYVFTYTPRTDECIVLESKTTAASGVLSSFEGCPYVSNSVCLQKAIVFNGVIRDQLSLEAGLTYYFVLSSDIDLDSCASFDFRLRAGSDLGADCAEPIVVTSLPYQGTNLLSTCKRDDFSGVSGCTSYSTDGDDMVFTYNSPGNECVSVSMKNKVDSADIALFISSDCPSVPSATCLASQDNFFSSTSLIGVEYQVTTPRKLWIIADRALSQRSPYLLYDLEINRNTITPEGKDCTTPLNVTTVPFAKKAISTACKGNDYSISNQCIESSTYNYLKGNDYVIRFTPSKSECIRISVKNLNGEGGFSMLSGCPSSPGTTCLGQFLCNEGTDSISIEFTVTAGTSYYLMASSFRNSTDLTFDLDIQSLSSSDQCLKCRDDICTNCANAGFEEMSGSKWLASAGDYNNPSISSLPIERAINSSIPNAVLNCAGSYDPIIGPELKTVSPYGGEYSLRLGDPEISNEIPGYAESATYTYTVDQANSNFYYYYAVVFEDPAHAVSDQPYFRVEMFDKNNVSIPCGFYEVTADGNIAGFKSSINDFELKWKNWTLVGVPLQNYIGQQIRIEFTIKDCRLGGHFGYAYIDAACNQPETVVNTKTLCGNPDTTTIIGPDDFVSYRWSNGATTQNIKVTSSGTYTLQAINFGGCAINFSFTVNLTQRPVVTQSAATTCSSNTAILRAQRPATTFDSWGWDFGNGVIPGDTVQYSYPTSGTYTADYVIKTGDCTFRYPQEFSIISQQFPTLPIDTVCTGDTSQFVLNFSDTLVDVTWFDGLKDKTRTFATPGNYAFAVVKGNCTLLDTVKLLWVTPPVMSLGPDVRACENLSFNITPTGGPFLRYSWNTGDTTESIDVNTSGVYQLTADFGHCLLKDSVELFLDSLQYFNFPPETTLCGFEPFSFFTGFPATRWQDNSTGVDFDVTGPGTYYATTTNQSCVYSDTVRVFVITPYNIQPIPDSILCQGDTYAVNVVTSAVSPVFVWNDGTTGPSKFITNPGVYTIRISDGPCIRSSSFEVTVVPRPTPNLGADFDTCTTSIFSLDPGQFADAIYSWNTGENSQSITVNQAGYYRVTVTKASCVVVEDVTITTTPPPIIDVGLDTTICLGYATPIDGTVAGGTIYLWSTGETTPVITVDKGGVYSVISTSPPCTVYDTIRLRELPSPLPLLPDARLCPDDSVVLRATTPFCQYLWNTGSTADSIYGHPINTYTVLITNEYDCFITDSSIVELANTCPELYVPNIFTPDGDGYNDYFSPVMFQVEIRLFLVFNRFGEIIFESRSQDPRWDGTYLGKGVKEDVYPWKLIYYTYDGTTHETFGHVTVLR